jgi:hypothetical protein
MGRWLAALVLLAWAFPAATRAGEEPLALAELMQRFAAMPGLEAKFEEERQIALLELPLRSSGSLYFAPPDALARHTESPARSSLVVEGDRMQVSDGEGERALDLAGQPLLRVFIDGFRLALRGDLAALERTFVLKFDAPAGGAWSLELSPRDPTLGRVLERVELRGRGTAVSEVRILELNGDATRLRFSGVDAKRSFSPEERARFFGGAERE